MVSIRRRLEALERSLSTAHITLVMEDGSIFRISTDGSTIIAAASAALRGEDDAMGKAILAAVSDDEAEVAGGGHLCECFRALTGIAYRLLGGELISVPCRDRHALREAVLAHARGEKSGNEFDDIACKLSAHDRGMLSKSEAPE
jgi:hypothetical protein